MNQTRTILLFAWIAVAAMLYMQWIREPEPATPATTPAAVSSAAIPGTDALPAAGTVPSADALPTAAPVAGAVPAATDGATAAQALLVVTTDVLRLRIDPRGGTLVDAELLHYPVKKENPAVRVHLLDAGAAHYSVAQSGLLATSAGGVAPTHEALFRSADGRAEWTLADGTDTIEVPLVWTDASGVTVTKTFVLTRGSYAVAMRQQIRNDGTQPWRGAAYEQLQRVAVAHKGNGFTTPEAYSFVGAAWFDPVEKFEKIKVEDLVEDGPQKRDATGGWIAMLQHHFALAWIPDRAEPQRFEMTALPGGRYLVRGLSPAFEVAPGASATREAKLWVGPKLQDQMQALAPGLNLTLDYGWFTFLAQPMFDYVLSPLHWLTGNWGWAIILTVLIIKLILYPLSAAQYRSFAKMRAIQPRLEALKERYGDDRSKFAQAQMELFKKEGINPMGGCLPILVTIPVFIALYWMLLESVEMRQAPWIGWIQNLTAPDPYFILPAINLVVMYLTQKMTPTPGMDPMQKKIMTFMPLAFGVMMAFFPSGLVLYWCTNGILGLLQQWFIAKRHGDRNGNPPARAATAK